ncbi:MAG: tRNA preQ1(34) S-adenosylmethionine ribosyltransferase-isomerase QueA [Phycisphaerales bacterium]|jgi:S-adenosylmethionine:tRNA ribosyltransferase-isomerase
MRTEQLDYKLPEQLIAQQPSPMRSQSRLLVMERAKGLLLDRQFNDIGEFLKPTDCLVINDTLVLQARFYAHRKTGGKLEGLFLERDKDNVWLVMLKPAARIKPGEQIILKQRDGGDFCTAKLIEKLEDGTCRLKIASAEDFNSILERIGFAPLPPYIKRSADIDQNEIDRSRYQTVYAQNAGAVAAPTAGLHFTDELIKQLKAKGITFARVTLHVGPGTFKPVNTDTLEEHKIHSEWFSINDANAELINTTKKNGGRIVAVGTTSVRVLETASEESRVKACTGQSNLFIKPPYEFKMVDAMVTNFHLPRSTLLALVAAFAGLEKILAAYEHAIEKQYRFYSYGDAMLII